MSFADFARNNGLLIDYVEADGQVHRCRTEAKPQRKNGAYLFDGRSGWIQDWTIHQAAIAYRDGEVGEAVARVDVAKIKRDKRAKHERAANEAASIVARCKTDLHPYLVNKGFQTLAGLVDGDRLVIPMRDFRAYGRVNSVQWIDAAGEKKFLTGGAAKGSVIAIGSGPIDWLCEGYATGLSIHAALKSLFRPGRVVVCFSAGNLRHISTLNDRRAYVMADNDSSRTGQNAAEMTGLPWVMPAEVGADANDLHQSKGIRVVAELMRSIM